MLYLKCSIEKKECSIENELSDPLCVVPCYVFVFSNTVLKNYLLKIIYFFLEITREKQSVDSGIGCRNNLRI